MSTFFCCLAKPSEEKGDTDSDTRNTMPKFRPSSPSSEGACCCYRCLMVSRPSRGQRRKRYFLRKAPQVCDAAVDTEIDFGIILHDMVKGDQTTYKDSYYDGENFDDKDMRDHKYASLQFDSNPGKVKYIEGSQVFYVEVCDRKMNPVRRSSLDKSISEEEADMESDMSTDVLYDPKSESHRRLLGELETKTRKKYNDGIVYVTGKCSPATSIESLTDKKISNRALLHNIEEAQELAGEYNFYHKDHPKTDTKDGYNIDGGHFARTIITPDDKDVLNLESDVRSDRSSSSTSVQSCIQTNQEECGANYRPQDFEGSEFADVSSQSVDEPRPPSGQGMYTPTATESKDSTDQISMPLTLFNESLFTLTLPVPKGLADDPSGFLVMDHTSSMPEIMGRENAIRESSSCPDVTSRSNSLDTSSLSSNVSRENTLAEESQNSGSGVLSVETQTDVFEETDIIDVNTVPEIPRHSVSTETEFDSPEADTNEETSRNDPEKVSTSNNNSFANSNNSENNESSSNSDSLSSTDSEGGSSSGESESSSNSGGPPKKKPPSNSSDSSCSTGSSSPKSVRKVDSKPDADRDAERRKNSKSSSSSSLESCSSNMSSSSCTLSSSSSICSCSTTSNQSDSAKEGSSCDLPNGNG